MTRSNPACLHAYTLADHLKTYLLYRRLDALKRRAEVLLAVLHAESTLHRTIALHLPWHASLESKNRTGAQGFHDAQLNPQAVTDILLTLIPDGKLTLIMDRNFLGRTDAHEDAHPQLQTWPTGPQDSPTL